jgi:hypothetical protein
MIEIGVASPSAHGQANEHGNGVDERIGEAWLGPHEPDDERQHREHDDGRHEPRRDLRQALQGARVLRLRHERDDL